MVKLITDDGAVHGEAVCTGGGCEASELGGGANGLLVSGATSDTGGDGTLLVI